MDDLLFSWNETKNLANTRKHGVSFEEARTIFHDENARLIPDPDHSVMEERYVMMGVSNRNRLLVVCHCYRQQEQVIRIISARKATRHEQRQYENF